jgi:hypothetical protein
VLPRNLEQGRAWAHDAEKVHQDQERGEQRYSDMMAAPPVPLTN